MKNNKAQLDESQMWQDAAGEDTLKHLGPISKEEYVYYMNLAEEKSDKQKTPTNRGQSFR